MRPGFRQGRPPTSSATLTPSQQATPSDVLFPPRHAKNVNASNSILIGILHCKRCFEAQLISVTNCGSFDSTYVNPERVFSWSTFHCFTALPAERSKKKSGSALNPRTPGPISGWSITPPNVKATRPDKSVRQIRDFCGRGPNLQPPLLAWQGRLMKRGGPTFMGEGGRVVWLTKGVSFGCEKREICHRGCPPRLMAAPFPLVGHQQERAPSPV
ncbi:hypothetical protein CDAR_241111 [Caerostris darwini]|uniref:Uncharacterized protein n=1 Tax=Caerostris darwini TaxID=1538125 RepID=A0AAV4THH4_9ARAC|nr:hypothetical protein CDAR_241111 [Caerostris darwini]